MPVNIVAHRGLWREPGQQNKISTLIDALRKSFGVELDIRDFQGKIIIQHDMPSENHRGAETLEEFFELCSTIKDRPPIFLDIKSLGIQQPLSVILKKFKNFKLFCI